MVTYHPKGKPAEETHAFLTQLLHLTPEYSGVNTGRRIPDRPKAARRTPPVQCFLTVTVAPPGPSPSDLLSEPGAGYSCRRLLEISIRITSLLPSRIWWTRESRTYCWTA